MRHLRGPFIQSPGRSAQYVTTFVQWQGADATIFQDVRVRGFKNTSMDHVLLVHESRTSVSHNPVKFLQLEPETGLRKKRPHTRDFTSGMSPKVVLALLAEEELHAREPSPIPPPTFSLPRFPNKRFPEWVPSSPHWQGLTMFSCPPSQQQK